MTLKEAVGHEPLLVVSGAQFKNYRAACVYVWARDHVVLYVGMSANGISRPLGSGHHKIKLTEIQDDDCITIWECDDAAAAVALERRLINLLHPEKNGTPEVNELDGVAEADLRKRLRKQDARWAGWRHRDALLTTVEKDRDDLRQRLDEALLENAALNKKLSLATQSLHRLKVERLPWRFRPRTNIEPKSSAEYEPERA